MKRLKLLKKKKNIKNIFFIAYFPFFSAILYRLLWCFQARIKAVKIYIFRTVQLPSVRHTSTKLFPFAPAVIVHRHERSTKVSRGDKNIQLLYLYIHF